MTCIVGLVEKDKVWIGGDSAGVAGWSISVRADEKVFVKGSMVFGFCGSFRVGQLLRYSLRIPYDNESEPMAYLVGPFINSVRQCMKDGGVGRMDGGAERLDGPFLVGYKGALYSIQGDFQVGQTVDGFDAVGAGEELALGSLATSTGSPSSRITKALGITERYSGAVCAPFHIMSGGKK